MSRQKLTSWFKIHRAMLKETANLRCASGLQKGTRSKNANCYSHSLHSDLKVFLSRCHCNRTKKKEKRKFAASGLLNYNTAKGLVNLKLSICHLVRLVALFEWLSFFREIALSSLVRLSDRPNFSVCVFSDQSPVLVVPRWSSALM